MKISKSSINANKRASNNVKATTNNRSEAVEYIQSAIHSLGTNAKDDVVAKESIANLSVILFDLKGS